MLDTRTVAVWIGQMSFSKYDGAEMLSKCYWCEPNMSEALHSGNKKIPVPQFRCSYSRCTNTEVQLPNRFDI
jgi:hypothetical protein